MAFTTRRGRPRAAPASTSDTGTDELRAKRSLGITTEPIDLCLARKLITPAQHWCGLHWRWLYTLRYGAPSLIARYHDEGSASVPGDTNDDWRIKREREYHAARGVLQTHRRYDGVMRLAIFNELPPFLNPRLHERAWEHPPVARQLQQAHAHLCEGLELLVVHWKQEHAHDGAT